MWPLDERVQVRMWDGAGFDVTVPAVHVDRLEVLLPLTSDARTGDWRASELSFEAIREDGTRVPVVGSVHVEPPERNQADSAGTTLAMLRGIVLMLDEALSLRAARSTDPDRLLDGDGGIDAGLTADRDALALMLPALEDVQAGRIATLDLGALTLAGRPSTGLAVTPEGLVQADRIMGAFLATLRTQVAGAETEPLTSLGGQIAARARQLGKRDFLSRAWGFGSAAWRQLGVLAAAAKAGGEPQTAAELTPVSLAAFLVGSLLRTAGGAALASQVEERLNAVRSDPGASEPELRALEGEIYQGLAWAGLVSEPMEQASLQPAATAAGNALGVLTTNSIEFPLYQLDDARAAHDVTNPDPLSGTYTLPRWVGTGTQYTLNWVDPLPACDVPPMFPMQLVVGAPVADAGKRPVDLLLGGATALGTHFWLPSGVLVRGESNVTGGLWGLDYDASVPYEYLLVDFVSIAKGKVKFSGNWTYERYNGAIGYVFCYWPANRAGSRFPAGFRMRSPTAALGHRG